MPSYATHNLTVGYRISDTLRAQAGVVNVSDKEIDLNALANGGFSVYDPIGRRYFLTCSRNSAEPLTVPGRANAPHRRLRTHRANA